MSLGAVELLRIYVGLLAGGNRRRFLVLLAVMLCAAGFEAFGLGLVMPFIALLQRSDAVSGWPMLDAPLRAFGVATHEGVVAVLGALLVVLFLLKNVFLTLSHALQHRFVYGRMVRVSRRLLAYYLYRPYTFYLRSNSAEAIRKIVADSATIFSGAIPNLLVVLVEGLTVGVIGALLIVLEPVAIPIAGVVVALGALATQRLISRSVMRLGSEATEKRTAMIRWANEALSGIKEVLVARRQPFFIERFNENLEANAKGLFKYRNAAFLPRHLLETFGVVGLVLVAVVALYRGYATSELIPLLGLLAVAVVRLMPGIARIMSSLTELQYYAPAARVLAQNLEEQRRTEQRERALGDAGAVTFGELLEIDGVSYTYPGATQPSLTDVRLKIARGQSVAFVGASGAGKTTLVDVIIGLLEPSAGTLKIDGRVLAKEDGASWASRIGYIPQHVHLCDDTLAHNIAFGVADKDLDRARLFEAVRGAQLETLVAELPSGLETVIGERGVRLSGGQRQRIGIARALYRDPQILVLDEATSALDGITEREVVQAIERLPGERTLIVIAHRLSSVRHCDKLVLLSRGRLVAEGSWAELLDRSDEFRKLTESADLGTR